jgi:hypothetical protein
MPPPTVSCPSTRCCGAQPRLGQHPSTPLSDPRNLRGRKGNVMNRYGRQAQEHWVKWRPHQLSQIPDPEAFFSSLGLQVETQVELLARDLAGDDPSGEGYLQKVGRLRMARLDAEAQLLREMVLLPPEPGHPEYDPEDDPSSELSGDPGRPRTFPAQTEWLPVVMMADDPRYHELDNDPLLRQTYPPEQAGPAT